MPHIKMYKQCLHCDAPLQQPEKGRRRVYCNAQHKRAYYRETALQMDRIEESLDKLEIDNDTILRLMETPGPVFQPLPQIAVWDVRNGVPMRVV